MATFSEALSTLDRAQLRALIRTRPDAFFPTPPTRASLATRLSLPASTARALRALNAADLRTLERLADLGAELEGVDATAGGIGDVGDTSRLRERALVYGPTSCLRIAPGALSALPFGWRISDEVPADALAKVADLPARQRRVLETLAASGGVGTTKAAAPDAPPDSPVAQLIAAGLLVRVDASTVRLPRPVREALAGGTPRTYPLTEPATADVNQANVDEAAAGYGLEFVRQTRQLVTELLSTPVGLNKDGTVGVRASAALGKRLGFDPSLAITVGESAGLVGRGVVDDTDALAATTEALRWLEEPLANQWVILLAGWLASPWRADSQGKLFSKEAYAPELRHARWAVLEAGGNTERLLYLHPLAASGMSQETIDAVTDEGIAVGALARAPQLAPSSPLAELLCDGDVASAAKALVPPEVTEVIAQADMTILTPGPLAPEAARFLERMAQLESPGLASVWRVSEATLRRALDGGLTAGALHEWLAEHTIGDVPQGLSFLIDDVARSHGAIRAGSALSYIRSDDPALTAQAAERVGARLLAPTVAVSQLALPRLLAQLRAAGLQPTAEDSQGVELAAVPEPALVPATPSQIPRPRALRDAEADRLVERLLADAGTRDTARPGAAGGAADGATDGAASGDTLETLRAAARGRRHVRLGYVDKNGRGATLTALPLSVHAGEVDVLDEATDKVVRVALPRITRVVLA